MNDTVTDSEMNEFTHAVADALDELLGAGVDRNLLNERLETLLLPEYGVRVVEDADDD